MAFLTRGKILDLRPDHCPEAESALTRSVSCTCDLLRLLHSLTVPSLIPLLLLTNNLAVVRKFVCDVTPAWLADPPGETSSRIC